MYGRRYCMALFSFNVAMMTASKKARIGHLPAHGIPGRHLLSHWTTARRLQPKYVCNEDCALSSANGECEDGGPGSQSSLCPFGTDCIDCDARLLLPPQPPQPPSLPPLPALPALPSLPPLLPPSQLQPPLSPPSPLPPLLPGEHLVHTAHQLHEQVCQSGAVLLQLVEGRTYHLGGVELQVSSAVPVSISSPGTGATIDAGRLSRHFRISPSSTLHLSNVRLINGFTDTDGGGAMLLERNATAQLTNVAVIDTLADGIWLHGGVFFVLDFATLTLSHSTVRGTVANCHAEVSSGLSMIAGGVFHVALGAALALEHCSIEDTVVTVGNLMLGGVFHIQDGARLMMEHCTIDDTRATSSSPVSSPYLTGAVLFITDDESSEISLSLSESSDTVRASAMLKHCAIRGTTATALGSWGQIWGGVISVGQRQSLTVEHTTITDGVSTATWEVYGGCLSSHGNIELLDTTITRCTATVTSPGETSAATLSRGGGLLIVGGVATLTRTLVTGNKAAQGANVDLSGGILYYKLPLIAGYWLPNSACVAYREPCAREDTVCDITSAECSLKSGNRSNGWRPTLTVDPPVCMEDEDEDEGEDEGEEEGTDEEFVCISSFQCHPPTTVQPCDWQQTACESDSAACVLGKKLYSAPHLPIDAPFPNPCAAGYLGSNESEFQSGPYCAGLTPPGTYQPTVAGLAPLPCLPGSYCPTGSVVPLPCPHGSYSKATNLSRADQCTLTAPGFYSTAGSFEQIPCAPGTIAPSGNGSVCIDCPAGSYQDGKGATVCRPCVLGSFCIAGASHPLTCESAAGIPNAQTIIEGASSAVHCRCAPDYYEPGNSSDKSEQIKCMKCPSGTKCDSKAGITLPTLPILRGYFRLHELSIDVRRCPDAAINCSGSSSQCLESTSGCRGTVNSFNDIISPDVGRRLQIGDSNWSMCYPDLTGTFCLRCMPHPEGKGVYYVRATAARRAHCAECRETARDSILILLGWLALVALVSLVGVVAWYTMCSPERKELLQYTWKKFTPHNKLKILISMSMIATKVDNVYEVTLPPRIKSLLGAMSIGVSLGFNGVSAVLECLGSGGYIATLILFMVAPVVIACLILFVTVVIVARRSWLGTERLTAKAVLEAALPAQLMLGFLAYPIVTNVAFDAFSCYPFTDSEWLKADVAIQCDTAEHDHAITLAWIAIVIYSFGMLVLNGALLFAARRAIQSTRPTHLSRSISFLYSEYEGRFFWWELMEMLRRLVLVGLMVLAQGSIMQLFIGTLLSVMFLLFQTLTAPYIHLSDNFLASGANFALVCIFLCATAFKYLELTNTVDLQETMALEQREIYNVSSIGLGAVMFASVVSALVLSLVIFLVQLSAAAKRASELRALGEERWLRMKESKKKVDAPLLPESSPGLNHYHVFLSHVWGTGQDQMRVVKVRLLEMIPKLKVFLDVDDLNDISDLEGHIERSTTIIVYCSDGYFTSKNCMRELLAAYQMSKPVIALTEPDSSRGGLSIAQVHIQLAETDALCFKWGFHSDQSVSCGHEVPTTEEHSELIWPGGEALHSKLFAHEPIEWNRIGHFQAVTMRQISERLLRVDVGSTYVEREITSQKLKPLMPPRASYHVFCSALNPGAIEIMRELSGARGFSIKVETAHRDMHRTLTARALARMQRTTRKRKTNELFATTDVDNVPQCDHMLLYLTSQTWTRGETSDALGVQLLRAMDLQVNVVLVHEMPGPEQDERNGCEFYTFFSCVDGATPKELLQRGIYSSLAVPFKGGPWREASMALLHQTLVSSVDDLAADQEDELHAARRLYRLKVPSKLGTAVVQVSAGLSAPAKSVMIAASQWSSNAPDEGMRSSVSEDTIQSQTAPEVNV